tara:strand:- start:46621 stop:46956 length:336 start_codon:yes stop_codon:yes gene_type:complete
MNEKQRKVNVMNYGDETSGAEKFLGFILIAPSIIYSGFVTKVYWGWFIMPLSESIIPLTIPLAVGINFLALMLCHKIDKDSGDGPVWKRLVEGTISCSIFWGMGWIVTLFM